MKWTLFIFILFVSSCTIERKIYSTLPVNNPSLQDKNDFSATASASAPGAFDFNVGFALTNRFAVIGGTYFHRNKDPEYGRMGGSRQSADLLYRHSGITAGAGFFFPATRRRNADYFSFYTGINRGVFKLDEVLTEYETNISNPVSVDTNFLKSSLNRYFLQGSFNHYGRNGELSFTSRLTWADYTKIITDYTNDQLYDNRLPPYQVPRTGLYLDIAFDARVYFSQHLPVGLLFFSQLSMRTNEGSRNYFYYPGRIGAGLFLRTRPGQKK